MDHGHGGSGHTMPMPEHDMPMDGPMCSMNMLWNSQVENVCVVFSSWHITGPLTMVISCLAIIFISIFYAYLLYACKNLDRYLAYKMTSTSSPSSRRESMAATRRESLIPPIPGGYGVIETGGTVKLGSTRLNLQGRLMRAGIYALTVALSFWLMLVAMTYNTYLFLSIVVGSFLGHLLYESEIDLGMLDSKGPKGLACH